MCLIIIIIIIIIVVYRTPTDAMSDMCIKSITDYGSNLDQLVYGVGNFVHRVVCVEHKAGESTSHATLLLARSFEDMTCY